MSHAPAFAFDELPRGNGGAGATEQIAQLLTSSGVDAPTSLYDEALELAREGRLSPATERLRMLLVLDPTDADAALLLGKVLASRGQWQESLGQLDSAAAKGAILPPGLRDQVESSLRRQVHDAEEHRARVVAREKGEMRSLRDEARRLRSENAALDQQTSVLHRRVKLWSSATAVVAGSASALLLAAMLFGSPRADPEATTDLAQAEIADVESGASSAVPAAATPTPSPKPPTKAAEALAQAPLPKAAAAPKNTPAPKAVAAPPVKAAPNADMRMHTVAKGENLGAIARKYYGKSSRWPEIMKANDDKLHGSVKALRPGMKLQIPS